MLGRYACLRLSELTTLHMWDRDDDRLLVRGQGDKERIVYANDDLLLALRRLDLKQPRGYYIPGARDGHLHPQSVHEIIKRGGTRTRYGMPALPPRTAPRATCGPCRTCWGTPRLRRRGGISILTTRHAVALPRQPRSGTQ